MSKAKSIVAFSAAFLLVAASAALAGTKYQANLVTASKTSPATNPTIANTGKLSVKDTGDVKAGIKGVTDGAGALVTTSQSYKDSGTLDGEQYIVILKLRMTALSDPNAPTDAETVIPVDLKKGNGSTKMSLSGLMGLLPSGIGRSMEIIGGEVWGPLGAANVTACSAVLTTGFAMAGDPSCRGGTMVGVAGINIP